MEVPAHLRQDDWQRFTVSKLSREKRELCPAGPRPWATVPVLITVPEGHIPGLWACFSPCSGWGRVLQ